MCKASNLCFLTTIQNTLVNVVMCNVVITTYNTLATVYRNFLVTNQHCSINKNLLSCNYIFRHNPSVSFQSAIKNTEIFCMVLVVCRFIWVNDSMTQWLSSCIVMACLAPLFTFSSANVLWVKSSLENVKVLKYLYTGAKVRKGGKILLSTDTTRWFV